LPRASTKGLSNLETAAACVAASNLTDEQEQDKKTDIGTRSLFPVLEGIPAENNQTGCYGVAKLD
jgi:hypothetical protein